MKKLRLARTRKVALAIGCSAVALLAINVASASAAPTSVNVSGGVLRVIDQGPQAHSIVIQDDSSTKIFVKDTLNGVSVGAGCTAKTISGARGATCAKTGFTTGYVNLGSGPDSVQSSASAGTRVDMTVLTNVGSDYVQGPTGTTAGVPFMTIHGGLNDDILNGGGKADGIYGGDGNDQIRGNKGSDQLSGDAGNDSIEADDNLRDVVDCGESVGDNDFANIDTNNLDSLIGASCERLG